MQQQQKRESTKGIIVFENKIDTKFLEHVALF